MTQFKAHLKNASSFSFLSKIFRLYCLYCMNEYYEYNLLEQNIRIQLTKIKQRLNKTDRRTIVPESEANHDMISEMDMYIYIV